MENTDQASNIEVNTKQKPVPNNVGIFVLGILSIVPGVISSGLLGIILGIITLSLTTGANEAISENPKKYTKSSIQMVKAGRICGIIGLTLSALFFIFLVVFAIYLSSSLMANPDYYL